MPTLLLDCRPSAFPKDVTAGASKQHDSAGRLKLQQTLNMMVQRQVLAAKGQGED